MARYVTKRTWAERKSNHDGKSYILYHYLLDDGHRVTSLNKIEVGDRVEHFWSAKLDREVILPYGYNKDKTV
jgi:hypothetical protein